MESISVKKEVDVKVEPMEFDETLAFANQEDAVLADANLICQDIDRIKEKLVDFIKSRSTFLARGKLNDNVLLSSFHDKQSLQDLKNICTQLTSLKKDAEMLARRDEEFRTMRSLLPAIHETVVTSAKFESSQQMNKIFKNDPNLKRNVAKLKSIMEFCKNVSDPKMYFSGLKYTESSSNPLYLAIACNQLDALKLLISMGALIDIKRRTGNIQENKDIESCLMLALSRDVDIELVDFIIKLGSDDRKQKLLAGRGLVAVLSQNSIREELVNFLINYPGAFPSHYSDINYKAVKIATTTKNFKVLKMLIARENPAKLVYSKYPLNYHILKIALSQDSFEIIEMMLKEGVGAIVKEAELPLVHIICVRGSLKLLKLCLKYKVDINRTVYVLKYRNGTYMKPLDIACAMLNFELIKMLFDNGGKCSGNSICPEENFLCWINCKNITFCIRDDLKIIESGSLEESVELTMRRMEIANWIFNHYKGRIHPEIMGKTLFYAIENNYIDMVELLLMNGADINIRFVEFVNFIGSTVAHVAVRFERVGILRLLLKYKLNLEVRDGKGKTALNWAKVMCNDEILQLLLHEIKD